MTFLLTAVGIFGLGVYIGVGAPGWPWKPESKGRLQKRSINPIAWGRTPGRERQRPKEVGERRFNVRVQPDTSEEGSRETSSRRVNFRHARDEHGLEERSKPRVNLRRS